MEPDGILSYAFAIIPFGLVTAVAIGFIAIVIGLYRNPLVGVASVIGMTVWDAAEYGLDPFEFGLNVFPHDIAFGCIGLAVLLRLVFVPGAARNVPRPMVLLLSLMAVSIVIGLARFGTKAGVEFRGDFYLWVGCLYLVSFPPEKGWLDRLLTWWMFGAFLLCVVVWYRWAADAFDLTWFNPIWRIADSGDVAFNRVAPAAVAFTLGLAFLVSIATIASGRSSAVHFVLMPALLMTIVILQHRTVWVATLLPTLLLLLLLRGAERQSARGPLVATVASIVVVVAVLGSGAMGGVERSVAEQAARATSTTGGTFVARVDGWRALLGEWAGSGPVSLVIGQPYGSGFERYQGGFFGGVSVDYAPHNYFVSILLRTGLLGLAALVALFWGLFRVILVQVETNARFGPPLVGAITLSLFLYSIPYWPTTESGLLLGAALCYAYAMRRGPARNTDRGIDAIAGVGDPADDDDRLPAPNLSQIQRGQLS